VLCNIHVVTVYHESNQKLYRSITLCGLQECRSTVESAYLASFSSLSVKIVASTQNPLSSQDELTQMFSGEVSHSDLNCV